MGVLLLPSILKTEVSLVRVPTYTFLVKTSRKTFVSIFVEVLLSSERKIKYLPRRKETVLTGLVSS